MRLIKLNLVVIGLLQRVPLKIFMSGIEKIIQAMILNPAEQVLSLIFKKPIPQNKSTQRRS